MPIDGHFVSSRLVAGLALLAVAALASCGGDGDRESTGGNQPAAVSQGGPDPGEPPDQGPVLADADPAAGRVPSPATSRVAAEQAAAADWECAKRYKFARAGGRPSCQPEEGYTVSAQTPGTPQQLLDGAFSLARDYAEQVVNSSFSDPITYRYLIYPQDCAVVSADTARCLVYLWKVTYATGYGAGGVDTGVWREQFFATDVGASTYSTRIIMVDFLDPYYWECSDTPRANTPRCT
jgi:hypothetical protein